MENLHISVYALQHHLSRFLTIIILISVSGRWWFLYYYIHTYFPCNGITSVLGLQDRAELRFLSSEKTLLGWHV
jgi:hypothetical protein